MLVTINQFLPAIEVIFYLFIVYDPVLIFFTDISIAFLLSLF